MQAQTPIPVRGGLHSGSVSDSHLTAPCAALPRESYELPQATPSCITSVTTLNDAVLLPQPPSRRICQPPSQLTPPINSFGAAAATLPGSESPFRSGAFAGAYSGSAFNSSAFNSGVFSSSVMHSGGQYNGDPFAGHPARSSTGELYNLVAQKKGVLVEFRNGSMETSEPSTRIGALTPTLPRGHRFGDSFYSTDRDTNVTTRRSRGSRRSAPVSRVRIHTTVGAV